MTRELDQMLSGLREGGMAPSEHLIWQLENRMVSLEESIKLSTRSAPAAQSARRTIDLAAELETFEQATVHLLADHDVSMLVEPPQAGLLRTELPPETFQQVLHILLLNSLESLDGQKGGRVRLTAKRTADRCNVLFLNGGKGVPVELGERIFEAGFSTKAKGRGMGLTIARLLLARHGGSLRLSRDRRRKGACFVIDMRAKRSRVTPR